jgi:1-acyl-sn-glycerol-3-phosphate acyltransferase
LGWTLIDAALPAPQGILIAYPHTSNWDFPIAMLAKWGLGYPVRFWAKASLFRWPLFGSWLRWIGAVPVHRSRAHGLVEQTVTAMRESPNFWLALSPEGTRQARPGWRMGFHHLWVAAQCPLAVGSIDWANRRIGVQAFLYATGDVARDFAAIELALGDVKGYHAHQAAPVVPWTRSPNNKE